MHFKSLIAASAVALTAVSTSATAAIELKYSSTAPANTPWVKHSEAIRDAVAVNSAGEIQINLFNGGQLGDELTVIKQVARGRIDFGGFSMTAAANMVPELALMGTPFLWDNFEQLDCAMDNHLAPVFESLFDKKGFKFVQWNELGWINVFGKQPLLTVADFDGYKIRAAPAKYSANFLKGMGANGIVLPFSETPAALQTGMIDGAALPGVTFVAAGFGKLAPHYTLSRHIHQSGMILMSKKSWAKLGAEGQQQFMDGLAPIAGLRAQVRGMSDFLLGKYQEAGGPVHELSDAQREQWKAAVLPGRDELVASIGGDSDRVWQHILAAKQACNQ